jgi:nucleoside-diphosphate-sugar epimerase
MGIGSGKEYGDQGNIVTEETPEYPTCLYGHNKYLAKIISETFCESYNIKWAWIRPFYTYGGEDVETRLIPKIINRIHKKEKRIELDSCETIVDYLYISDFCDALVQLAEQEITGLFNICSGNPIKLRDIIDKISQKLSADDIIKFGILPTINTPNLVIAGSNLKLKNVLSDWCPLTLDQGLEKTIEFYKNL